MLAAAEALELAVDGRLDELAVEDALLDVLEVVDADEDSKEVDVDEVVVEVELREAEALIDELLELEVDRVILDRELDRVLLGVELELDRLAELTLKL